MRQRKAIMAVMMFMAATVAAGAWANSVPTITSVTPNNGPIAGGTVITIRGSGFKFGSAGGAATGVNFGANPGTAFTVTDDKHITVTTPASTTGGGFVNVVLTGAAADGYPKTLASGFQYNNNTLTINVVALINAVIDIAWDDAAQTDSGGTTHTLGTPGDTSNFLWDVGGVPGGGLVPISTGSSYILSQDFAVNVRNQGSGITVNLAASVNAATTGFAGPATTGWTLVATPPAGVDNYSLQALIGGAGTAGAQDLVGHVGVGAGILLGTIAPATSVSLDLTYGTPTAISDTSANGNQTTIVTLTATKAP